MKKSVRWFLFFVLVFNVVGLAFLGGGGLPSVRAQEVVAAPDGNEAEIPERDALRMLGEQLARRAEALTRREAELEELLRGEEVLRRSGLGDGVEDTTSGERPSAEVPVSADPSGEAAGPDAAERAFAQLSRAYENMEPESAARALSELSSIDQEAVVQLLSTWQPRTSGAILDALTQTHPTLAAQLSYEIWKRSGKE